jgi:hypothetical protein
LIGAALAFFVAQAIGIVLTQIDYCSYHEANNNNCPAHYLVLIPLIWIIHHLEVVATIVTAIATAYIAKFTATIYSVNKSQLAHGRQVERAYVNGGWGRFINDGVQANMNNDGRTGAMVHHMALAILPLDGLPQVPADLPRTFVNYNIQPSGRAVVADHVSVDWDGEFAPERVLYGRFWYTDIFGDEHESGFLLHVRPGTPAVDGFPRYWHWT